MVSNDVKRYRYVLLFGTALYFELNFGDVWLDDTQTNLAFKFYNLLSTGNGPPKEDPTQAVEGTKGEGGGEPEDNEVDLYSPWDNPKLDLPESLQAVWFRAVQPMSTEVRRLLLEDVPEVPPIPVRALDDTYRKDGQREMDRLHKNWQTSIFQAMRLLATTQACMDADDPPVDPREILQKSFIS